MSDLKVKVYVLSGLGHEPSDGIIYGLARKLAMLAGVEVWVGSHANWEWVVQDARSLPDDVQILLLGHSLGASILPELARRIGKPVEAIYGWDPADNLAANFSEYRLTPVPDNVALAVAIYKPGGALGGGTYSPEPDNENTVIKNKAVDEDSHVDIEEAVEDHLRVVDVAERLAA